MTRSRSNFRELLQGNCEDNREKAPISNKSSSDRVHEIEKILGFCLSPSNNKTQDSEAELRLEIADQTIQLVCAFGLITDVNVRAEILEFVIAAAQRESGID